MFYRASEKLSENNLHHKEHQKWHKHAPSHAKDCTLVLLFEIPLDEFFKKKLILAKIAYHIFLRLINTTIFPCANIIPYLMLKSPFHGYYAKERSDQNPNIHPRRPIEDIVNIKCDPLFITYVTSPGTLPKPRNSRFHT